MIVKILETFCIGFCINLDVSLNKRTKLFHRMAKTTDNSISHFLIDAHIGASPVNRFQFLFLLCRHWDINKKKLPVQLFLFENNASAENFYDHLIQCDSIDAQMFFYPAFQSHPYSAVIEPEDGLLARIHTLQKTLLANRKKQNVIVVSSLEACISNMPSISELNSQKVSLHLNESLSPFQLAGRLVEIGYVSRDSVHNPGEFAHRGEIFDIFVDQDTIFRITYFDDVVESIHTVDISNQRSNLDSSLSEIEILASFRFISKEPYTLNFRNNCTKPAPKFSLRNEERNKILNSLDEEDNNSYITKYFPLFLGPEKSTLLSLMTSIKSRIVVFGSLNPKDYIGELLNQYSRYREELVNDPTCEIITESIEKYFTFSQIELTDFLKVDDLFLPKDGSDFIWDLNRFFSAHSNLRDHSVQQSIFQRLRREANTFSKVFVCISNDKAKSELSHLIFEDDDILKNKTEFIKCSIENGFYICSENVLVLSESDFFINKKGAGKKRKKTNKEASSDFFAEQLASIRPGDYLVHSTHGIGVFEGIQTINQSGQDSDYVVINYADNDKVYVPVYKLNLIQKYASSENKVKVDSLRLNNFSTTKSRVRKSVKKLAFDLLKLEAERNSRRAPKFSADSHNFREFELGFPFVETPDQELAINDCIMDLSKEKPMDRLICGDVGFGKTEVAMRAAFLVAESGFQVVVLAPTTILALQHYNNFKERFKNFPLNIEMISRLRSKKDIDKALIGLKEGIVDILIGTHAVLSNKIKYKNIGLLIIDEEHRFGVSQKEQIKLLKSDVHCLTLTATPIPRTLQLSFLGIKDFSIIKTPPPLKQSVNTILLKEDDIILTQAIKSELERGGQVFVVHNRVMDIELYAEKIRQLVPKSKIVIAHGQLAPKDIEKRIMSFYRGDFDVLLATTIIESGIDIPNANTMIIYNSHLLGLAQLHQLRGRIGRSDKKAFAYFVIPKSRELNNDSEKRLKALQMYSDLGSGFSLASSDLEIRGSGDILGAEQSGHINEIGLELYLELLKEAMAELKGEEISPIQDIEILTPFKAQIPSDYISNTSKRISYYKRISSSRNHEEISSIKVEIVDIYGTFPQELENLFTLITIRNILAPTGLKSLRIIGNEITLQFDQDILSKNNKLQMKIADYFLSKPGEFRFSPGHKVTHHYDKKLDPSTLLNFANNIAQQIIPC